MKKINAAITGVQGYLPDTVVTNHDLAKIVDTSDEWITSRTGVKERRLMKDGATSDMAAEAVKGFLAFEDQRSFQCALTRVQTPQTVTLKQYHSSNFR